jgi:hypothetical protein
VIAQTAYVAMCLVAWIWGFSQARYALRGGLCWPPPWRATAAVWLLTKAGFLTYVGVAAWDDMAAAPHVFVVVVMALVHLWAFAQWVRLPDGDSVTPDPPGTVSGLKPRPQRRYRWFGQ